MNPSTPNRCWTRRRTAGVWDLQLVGGLGETGSGHAEQEWGTAIAQPASIDEAETRGDLGAGNRSDHLQVEEAQRAEAHHVEAR